jgi:hypothetical protein
MCHPRWAKVPSAPSRSGGAGVTEECPPAECLCHGAAQGTVDEDSSACWSVLISRKLK